MTPNQNKALITGFEWSLVQKLKTANYPAATATKRFIRDLSERSTLTDRGRAWLGRIAYRVRRQYSLTKEQWAWVNQWRAVDQHTGVRESEAVPQEAPASTANLLPGRPGRAPGHQHGDRRRSKDLDLQKISRVGDVQLSLLDLWTLRQFRGDGS